jgi:hypothetical protein
MDYPPLRIVRLSGEALTVGVEDHVIDGVPVRVTSVARTVADCFKFRNKIGLDVALEALQEAWCMCRPISAVICRGPVARDGCRLATVGARRPRVRLKSSALADKRLDFR